MNDIVRELHTVHASFLAGTDSDNYPFQVSGFALLEELRLLKNAGLSTAEALRSATTEPARAVREPKEFGRITEGMRADLVLLDANPLNDVSALRQNRGVTVRGLWLEREKLNAALAKLAQIYAESDEDTALTEPVIQATVEHAQSLNNSGFVLDSTELMTLASQLRKAGYGACADALERVADIPKDGPCAERRP